MKKWRVRFFVGSRTVQMVIMARDLYDARQQILSQYPTADNINIIEER